MLNSYISDIKQFPESMTVEDILVQSSNIGTINNEKIEEEKYKDFKDLTYLMSEFELDEIGRLFL